MTQRQREHAQQVVNRFRDMLSQSGREHVGEKHFDELSLLIESAISTAILEELEKAADRMDQLAHDLRNFAEHYDKPENAAKSA